MRAGNRFVRMSALTLSACKPLPQRWPGKSIQRYLAMYPRINGQVSSITWRSKLAAFSCPVCSEGQDGCLNRQKKGDVKRPAGVSGARSCRCSCPSVCGGEVPGIQWTETSRAVLSAGDCPWCVCAVSLSVSRGRFRACVEEAVVTHFLFIIAMKPPMMSRTMSASALPPSIPLLRSRRLPDGSMAIACAAAQPHSVASSTILVIFCFIVLWL